MVTEPLVFRDHVTTDHLKRSFCFCILVDDAHPQENQKKKTPAGKVVKVCVRKRPFAPNESNHNKSYTSTIIERENKTIVLTNPFENKPVGV